MRVTYIGHSGFVLETEKVYFIFDYFEGTLPEMKAGKDVVVFSSHRHHDHFNPQILELVKSNHGIQYVLSDDIPIKRYIQKYEKKGIHLEQNIHATKPDTTELLKLPNGEEVKIRTLKSTDEGVAFLLEHSHKIYYHAGDLNCWDWEEKRDNYRHEMVRTYTNEIQKIKGFNIEAAFVPLDPRLENTAFEGIEIFMKNTDSKNVFPMHCWGKYDIIKSLLDKHPEYEAQVHMIYREGQVFEL